MSLYAIMTVGEFFGAIPPGLYALIGTLFGGVALKVVESWLNRSKDNSELRKTIHDENKDLYDRISRLEDEVTQWRQRYYLQEEQIALLRTMLIENGVELPERLVVPPGMGE